MSQTQEDRSKTALNASQAGLDSSNDLAAINGRLGKLENRLVKTEGELAAKIKEWQVVKSRRLDPNHLANVAMGLYAFTGAGFIALTIYFLLADRSWIQVCGVLGIALLWVTFSAVSMRLLSERCK